MLDRWRALTVMHYIESANVTQYLWKALARSFNIAEI